MSSPKLSPAAKNFAVSSGYEIGQYLYPGGGTLIVVVSSMQPERNHPTCQILCQRHYGAPEQMNPAQ
jgi:hypothetical protein